MRGLKEMVARGYGCVKWLRMTGGKKGKSGAAAQPQLHPEPMAETAFREMIENGARGCNINTVCIFGEARRGKSTLMNLLVDAPADCAVFVESHKDQACT